MTSVFVLSSREFRDTFHRLLICLSLVDCVFILCAVFTLLVRSQALAFCPSILAPESVEYLCKVVRTRRKTAKTC